MKFNTRPLNDRLCLEAAVAFGHLKIEDIEVEEATSQIPCNALEYLGYMAGRVVDIFCQSIKDPSRLKKFANCIGLFVEWLNLFEMPVNPVLDSVAKEMMVTKTVLGTVEVFSKWESVVKPLRERTVFVKGQNLATPLEAVKDTPNVAPEAPLWEKAMKKATQVADWVFGFSEFSQYVMNSGVVAVSKEVGKQIRFGLSCAMVVSGFTISGFSLWEEGHKLSHGYIVRSDPSVGREGQVKHADGFIWKMTWEDQVHSWIKIAMSVAFLVLTICGACGLGGILLPGAAVIKTVAVSVSTVTALGSYFWERIAVDSLERSLQGYVNV